MSEYVTSLVRKYPPITHAQEKGLLERYHDGDAGAGEQLVCSAAKSLYQVALSYHKHVDTTPDDCFADLLLTAFSALSKFDPGRSSTARFHAYASWVGGGVMNKKGRKGQELFEKALYTEMGGKLDGKTATGHWGTAGEKQAISREALYKVVDAAENLPARSKALFDLRLRPEKSTLQVLSKKFGVSKERIRQIEAETNDILRKAIGD